MSSAVLCCFRQWLVPRVGSIKFANLTLRYCHMRLAYRRGGLDYWGPTGKLPARKPSLCFHLCRQQWLNCKTKMTVLYAFLLSRFPRFFSFSPFLFTLLYVHFPLNKFASLAEKRSICGYFHSSTRKVSKRCSNTRPKPSLQSIFYIFNFIHHIIW